MRQVNYLALAIVVVGLTDQASAAVQWRKPDVEPGFKGLSKELQHLVDRDGRTRLNTFCAVIQSERQPKTAINRDGGYTWLLANWKQEHLLYTFGAADDQYGLTDMNIFHSMPLDLRRDVVASEKQIGGSTFLVTRTWVANVEQHCKVSGTTFTIIRTGAK